MQFPCQLRFPLEKFADFHRKIQGGCASSRWQQQRDHRGGRHYDHCRSPPSPLLGTNHRHAEYGKKQAAGHAFFPSLYLVEDWAGTVRACIGYPASPW